MPAVFEAALRGFSLRLKVKARPVRPLKNAFFLAGFINNACPRIHTAAVRLPFGIDVALHEIVAISTSFFHDLPNPFTPIEAAGQVLDAKTRASLIKPFSAA